eukprot:TRINITY_DN4312_c0_g1_i1.p1 TRINITY_DN4312_c0_g1~~TRINITY_DN4312_c0_g1_i1.p1  ORF type:complete len:303 (+),score=65.70 TRINITY_DN4312_c0_g1_i1:65-973(+)
MQSHKLLIIPSTLRCLRTAFSFRSFPLTTRRFFSTQTPAGSEEITFERLQGEHEGIAVLSLNRPKVKNALGKQLISDFRQTLHDIRFDSTVRVVVLRSKVDGAFCSGADLKERATMQPQEVASFVHSLRSTFTEIESLPMPTIAAIEGIALGGGTELALSCDIRIASKSAKMGLPETGLAIIPGAGGTQRLPRLIGKALAKELIFTAEVLSSQRAKEIGLVEHEVETGEAYNKAIDLAKKMLKNGPIALRMAKIAIDKGMDMDIQSGMILEQQCYAQVIPTKDRLEGLLAFKEKRPPKYLGE